jgi:hypothetical protein
MTLALACAVGLRPGVAHAQRSGHLVVDALSTTEPPVRRLDGRYRLAIKRFEDVAGQPWWEVTLRRSSDTAWDNLLYHSREWHGPYLTHVGAITIAQGLFPETRVLPGYRGAPYVVVINVHNVRIAGADTAAVLRGGSFDVSWRPKAR